MAAGFPANQAAIFDGLQLAEKSEQAEKYPASRSGDSNYLLSTEDGGLYLVSEENPLDHSNATQAS